MEYRLLSSQTGRPPKCHTPDLTISPSLYYITKPLLPAKILRHNYSTVARANAFKICELGCADKLTNLLARAIDELHATPCLLSKRELRITASS